MDNLIDNDVVRVNVIFGEILDKPFRLVEAEKLGNTDTDKGGLLGVGELAVDVGDGGTHGIELGKEVVAVDVHAHHGRDLGEHAAESAAHLGELAQGFFQDAGEGEETEGVAGGRRVKDDDFVVHAFDESWVWEGDGWVSGCCGVWVVEGLLHDFGEIHGFIYAWNRHGHFVHHVGEGIPGIRPAVF